MNITITSEQSLKSIETNISKEVAALEYWGELEISFDELENLRERLKVMLAHDGVDLEYICKVYPHAIVTFMVFFVRYKYDTNFWGVFADELNIILNQQDPARLGSCARKMFKKYGMDISDTADEVRVNLAPIMFEACLPPESSLDDLFYIFSYDTQSVFDPQLIIEELIEMRSFLIRKPLLRFLNRFKDDKAIDYLLEVRDAMISAEQKTAKASRYSSNYSEWKENEKSKSGIANRKKQEFQTKPYLFFDNGKKGLCMILPRTILASEWVAETVWTIRGSNGFEKKVRCGVIGDEGRRYVESVIIPISPCEKYIVSLEDSEQLDDIQIAPWEIDGVFSERFLLFNANGRLVSANYLPIPYGFMVLPNDYSIQNKNNVDVAYQSYPSDVPEYKIISVTPLGSTANLKFMVSDFQYDLCVKPTIGMTLVGSSLFSLENTGINTNIFTDIPTLRVEYEGISGMLGYELRIGSVCIPIELQDDSNEFDIKRIARKEIIGFGTYSIRLYQFGRFIKQIEFSYVPKIKTNYSSNINWPDLAKRKNKIVFKFQRLDDWGMEFSNCTVSSDESFYWVECTSDVGKISVRLQSLLEEFIFGCNFDLPINPFELELLNSSGDVIEKVTDHNAKIEINEFIETEKWLSIKTFGIYSQKNYSIVLKTPNGIEQRETVNLSQNGAGNVNLSAFFDTLRNCPLPAELLFSCDEDDGSDLPFVVITQKQALEKNPKYLLGEKNYIILDLADDGKDIAVARFGFDRKEVHILYEESKLSKKGTSRGYIYPGVLSEGIYVITGTKEQTFFEFEEDENVELVGGNNEILVSCREKGAKIETIKQWLDLLVTHIIGFDNGQNIELLNSIKYFRNHDFMRSLQKVEFDDCDIEKLVALAFYLNSNYTNDTKTVISECMRYIAVNFFHRGDRLRILTLLMEMHVSQEVFDICLKEYSLLLFYGHDSKLEELASKVQEYSVELSMLLMMSTNGPIRDCLWKDRYKEYVGKDSLKKFLSVPGESDDEIVSEERKKFLREIPGNAVRIGLDDEIGGNEEAIQGMIGYDKKMNPIFDITKKPEYGVYFGQIKYVDQYVNWYKINHNRSGEMEPQKRQQMIDLVRDNYHEVLGAIEKLQCDKYLWKINKQYRDVIQARYNDTSALSLNANCHPRYFYIQGLAAFLAKLPGEREDLDELRDIGIRFMSDAFAIAPRLSKRDLMLAGTFIYLKKKEEKLCR